MLTIFSCPKPFRGHSRIIQMNAIRSWTMLQPKTEIILLGDEEGTAGIAGEYGLRHLPEIERNEFGTPLISSIIGVGQGVASHQLVCYINADIVLMSDFLTAVQQVLQHVSSFLLIGRRWDVNLNDLLDFEIGWEERLRVYVKRYGRPHPHTGIDFFVFPKGLLGEVPRFAIGRTAYDGWMIYRTRTQGVPVIDLSDTVTVVHQNHDFFHRPGDAKDVRQGIEARANMALAGGDAHVYHLGDATHRLTRGRLERQHIAGSLYAAYRNLLMYSTRFRPLRLLVGLLRVSRITLRRVTGMGS